MLLDCINLKSLNYNPDTPDTNCKSISNIEKLFFNGFLKIIGEQNQLPITFC